MSSAPAPPPADKKCDADKCKSCPPTNGGSGSSLPWGWLTFVVALLSLVLYNVQQNAASTDDPANPASQFSLQPLNTLFTVSLPRFVNEDLPPPVAQFLKLLWDWKIAVFVGLMLLKNKYEGSKPMPEYEDAVVTQIKTSAEWREFLKVNEQVVGFGGLGVMGGRGGNMGVVAGLGAG